MASAPTGTASEHAGTASELTSAASRAADTSEYSVTTDHVRCAAAARSVALPRDDGNASGDSDIIGQVAAGMRQDERHRAHIGADVSKSTDAIVLLRGANGSVAGQEAALHSRRVGNHRCDPSRATSDATPHVVQAWMGRKDFGKYLYDDRRVPPTLRELPIWAPADRDRSLGIPLRSKLSGSLPQSRGIPDYRESCLTDTAAANRLSRLRLARARGVMPWRSGTSGDAPCCTSHRSSRGSYWRSTPRCSAVLPL